jgi:hypothetical protein
MNNNLENHEEYDEDEKHEDVVLNLTLTGARECILDLLEQMDSVKGFSVLDGSFIVNSGEAYIP